MHKYSTVKKILLTTPDYPPKIGGLSTFTINIENTLKHLNIPYEIFQWSKPEKLAYKRISKDEYSGVINIHFLANLMNVDNEIHTLNFFHGSEILFESKNIIKKVIKNLKKKELFQKVEKAHLNAFISNFTLEVFRKQGFKLNYSRDFVVHNGISIDSAKLHQLNFENDVLKFIVVARDVPHKNLNGCVDLVTMIAKTLNRKVSLKLTSERQFPSPHSLVQITSLPRPSNEALEMELAASHFNLLLSLDHSLKGYFEGFGLAALEAGKFGTPTLAFPSGGLAENIHDGVNGFFVDKLSEPMFMRSLLQMNNVKYELLRANTFEHTTTNHSLKIYNKIMNHWYDSII